MEWCWMKEKFKNELSFLGSPKKSIVNETSMLIVKKCTGKLQTWGPFTNQAVSNRIVFAKAQVPWCLESTYAASTEMDLGAPVQLVGNKSLKIDHILRASL